MVYSNEKLNSILHEHTGNRISRLVWTGVNQYGHQMSPDQAYRDISRASSNNFMHLHVRWYLEKEKYVLKKDMPYVGEYRCSLIKTEKVILQIHGYIHMYPFEAVTNKIIKSWPINPDEICK